MAKTPVVEYIEEDDIGILRLKQGEVARTLERKPCVLVDVDKDGYPLSIEILGLSKINAADLLRILEEFVTFMPHPVAA